jgi:hypothetical protein
MARKNKRKECFHLPENRERERPSEYGVEEKLFFVFLLAKALDKETTGWQAFDR